MSVRILLTDKTIDMVMKKLKEIVEESVFKIGNVKFLKGKIEIHPLKDVSERPWYSSSERPMILIKFNGTWSKTLYEQDELVVYENQIIFMPDTAIVKSKVTNEEAQLLRIKEQDNIVIAELSSVWTKDSLSDYLKTYDGLCNE